MRVVMTLLVRDEVDVVPWNLEYHLAQGVDYIIATDNRSRDGATSVLKSFESQGLLHYIEEPAETFEQSTWVTRMARMAAVEYGADWVINNDSDEFWMPSRGNLKDVLGSVPDQFQAVSVRRLNFSPLEQMNGLPFFESMTIRDTQSVNILKEPLPGKTCHRGLADVEVSMGNHQAFRFGVPLPSTTSDLEILHFPIRSIDQLSNKAMNGGLSIANNPKFSAEAIPTWRYLYQAWRAGRMQEIWDDLVLSDDQVRCGLESGALVRDERLRDFLRPFLDSAAIPPQGP